MPLDHGRFALITYWEAGSESDSDVYRCVDIADSSFETLNQRCWRALRPSGRAPPVVDGVTSSRDLCGQPNAQSPFGEIAFCDFSDAFTVRTAYFSLVLEPFENGGLVSVSNGGRHLLVTDEELPASVFFEVRADSPAAYPELSGLTGPDDLLTRPPEGSTCVPVTISTATWIRCEATDTPLSVTHYTKKGGTVYSVAFGSDASLVDSRTIGLMFDSLQAQDTRD